MKIAFNPSTVAALITPPNNKDITFDLRGRNIFARGVKFCGTDTWRDIKINNVSIGSNILDLRDGSNTTLTNTNGVVTINSTWRPVVDNLTSNSTTSSLSANQGRVLKSLIDGKSNSGHTHDDRYLKLTGGIMQLGEGLKFHADYNYFGTNSDARIISLLDNNDTICDGGLIIDERGTLDGKEYVTELLRIRDSEFKWKGSNILHNGNSHINGNTITINGSSLTVSKSDHTHAYLPLTGGTMTGSIAFSNSSYLLWNNGSYHQRIFLTDDSTADTAVFTFQQSSDSGVNWSNLMTIRDNGKVIANTFVGALQGNASTATKLTSSAGNAALPIYFSDGKPVSCTASSIFSNLSNSGNNISVTVAGQNRTLTVGYATSAGYANGIANKGLLDSQEKIDNFITANRFEYATFKTTESNNLGFDSNDGMILSIPWDSTSYGAQMAFDDVHSATVKVRGKSTSWGNWYTLLHSGNYNNYAPSKTGTGASGTWGINISGNAATATSAVNADTLDGNHASAFATAGHNHNDLYVSSLTTNGNYLRWVKNGNNNDITIPYATGSSNLMYRSLIGYRTDFDRFTGESAIKVALFQNRGTDDEALVPPFYDGSLISFPWGNDNNYGAQLAVEDGGQTNHLAIRNKSNPNTWGAWAMILTSANYNLYSPKLDGTGASGTWDINITGNADTVDGVHVKWEGALTSTSHLVAWESDGSALRDINPAHVSVGNSDKLDGFHANGLLTALSNSNNGVSITVGGTTKSINNISVNYANSAGNANTLDGIDSTKFLRQVVVPNNTENDFNTFSNMTLTGRVDPTTGASLKNAPWSGSGPAGGYGVLTYLFNGSGYGTQMAWEYGSNRIYIRNRHLGGSGVGSVWRTSWDMLALTTDIPSSLKNPYSLTLKANGTTLATYDGSSAKEANFTYANIGAASASHTHTAIVAEDLRAKYPGQILDPKRMKLSFLSASTLGIKNDGSYYDVITVRSYGNSSGGSDNALLFSKNTNSLYHTGFAFGSTSSWGSPLLIIDSGNIGSQSVAYASKAGSVAWANVTGKPSSLKNPYSLNIFGVVYDGSAAKTVTTSTFVSQLEEGTSTITDGTMFITSLASDSGFADTNAVNVPYKRKASCLWSYIDNKVSSKYLPLAGGTMNGNARIGHGSGNLYIGNSGNDGWIYTQDIASQLGTDKWYIRESGAANFGNVYICTKSNYTTYNSSIIECYNDTLYLNYYSSTKVILCNGGGSVGIGTVPSYKLDVNGQVKASGFHHGSINSDNYILLAGGGYKSYGGSASNPIFLGYLNLSHGNDGTIDSYFYCLGYSVSFTYTRGGNYCKISIPDTTHQAFYIKAATASVNYSGGGMDNWTGEHRGDGAWWLHCYASGNNDVRVKGFRNSNGDNDSWWGGNPLYSGSGSANVITVCLFGYVDFR